jgi:transposase
MPAPLSQDLRARVAASLDERLSYTEVQESFGVSRSFVATFARRYRATGSIPPLPPDPGPDPTLGAREW